MIFDEITYPMILLGAAFNLAEFNLNALILGAAVFAFGYVLYFTGKIGGGDVKLFTGITLLVPFVNESIFILNVFLASIFVSIIFISTNFFLKYAKKGIKIPENHESIKKAVILAAIIAAYFSIGISSGIFSQEFVLFAGIPAIFALVFISLEQGIKKHFFLQKIPVEKLEEDDIIAQEFLDKKTNKELNLAFKGIIDKKVQQKLIELKVLKVPVYRNLPKFAPFILIGVIISIFFPELIKMIVP